MDASRIEEVIGDFVSLRKRGANHIGCCPFHNEKTPSFYVSPSKGIFKCFGCGKAGDVVTFLKEHEHYSYVEALEYLAKKYHIEIHEEEQTEEQRQRQTERDGLFHVSEFAQKYFADLLVNDEMGRAVGLSYFHGRGMSDEIIRRFGLGFCLDEWRNFTDHALKSGYSLDMLEKSGLSIVRRPDEGQQGDVRVYDRFRGRVMFPIYSISGRVLGFSGRVLSSEKQAAKYVNSPDSEIYNKSRTLYGLFQARSAIARADKCYLVEGNVDVVSMHQSGVENTVASCGTSLTVEQIRLIKRYTPNVTVLYDGDSAGIKAALRAVNLLFEEGMHVRVVLFPDGDDPDSYAQKYGSAQLQQYLATHEDNFVIFKTRVLLDSVQGDPIRKAGLVKETVDTIALVPDLLERAEYIRQCASLLEVPEETLAAELGKSVKRHREKVLEDERRAASPAAPTPAAAAPGVAAPAPDAAQPSEADAPSYQPPAPNPLLLPVPEAERHLVALLLNYGNNPVTQLFVDDEGHEQVRTYTVAQIIAAELEADELSLSDSRCQTIYAHFRQAYLDGTTVDPHLFTTYADEGVRQLAFSLMLDTYTISKGWENKRVHVPTIEENLDQDVAETLFNFKMKCIDARVADNARMLRLATKLEDVQRLLAEKQQLITLRRQLGAKLHRVVTG